MAVKRSLDNDQTKLAQAHPREVSVQAALEALADPVRCSIVRQLAASPDWSRPCGSFELPVTNATASHHFAVLRSAGLIEQRSDATRRLNRLRRAEFDERFPGLLALVLDDSRPG
jgi:DNA-binding transcriptional ArsR family regulator